MSLLVLLGLGCGEPVYRASDPSAPIEVRVGQTFRIEPGPHDGDEYPIWTIEILYTDRTILEVLDPIQANGNIHQQASARFEALRPGPTGVVFSHSTGPRTPNFQRSWPVRVSE